MQVIGDAVDGHGVLKLMQDGAPCNLLILDVNMPNMNGIETVTRMKKRGYKVPILMLSMDDTERTIIQLLISGLRAMF